MGVVKGDRTIVRKNSTGSDMRGRRVNFIEGSNVTLTVAADSANNEVDVTIAATGSGGSPTFNMPAASVGKVAYWANMSSLSYASGLAWDSSNTRLGVGVSTPVALLDLAGTDGSGSGVAAAIKLTNLEPGGASWFMRAGATGTGTPAGGLSFANNSNYYLTFDSSGRVSLGPGTPNEQATLHGRLSIALTTGASNASGYGKQYVKPDGNLYYLNPTGTEYALTPPSSGSGTIAGSGLDNKLTYFATASTVSTATGLTYNATDRKLGINTSSPTAALQIGGGGDIWLGRHDTAGGRIRMYYNTSDGYIEAYGGETFAGEQGLIIPQMRLTAGRFDFDESGGKAEIRVTGAGTQINWYNKTNSNFIMQVESSDRSSRWYGDMFIQNSRSSDIISRVYNDDNGNGTANAAFVSQVAGTGGGDPKINFIVPATTAWTMGIDNSDNDYIKISAATVVGTNVLLVGNTSGYAGIGTTNLAERLNIEGRIALSFTTGASQVSGYGKVYMKPTDSKLYFLDPAGVEYDLTATGSGGGGTVAGTGVANYLMYWANASAATYNAFLNWAPATNRLSVREIGIGRTATTLEMGLFNDPTGGVVLRSTATDPGFIYYNSRGTGAHIWENRNSADTAWTEMMRLTGEGEHRLGIGTTTPPQKLSISGPTFSRIAIGFSTYASQSSGYGIVHTDITNKNLLYTNDSGRVYKLNNSIFSTATSTATWSVDLRTGLTQKTMLSAATVTVWLQNPADGETYTLVTRQDTTGGRYLLWPSSVIWAGGTTPVPTSSATYVDIYKLHYDATDGIYRAVPTLNFAK